MIEIENPLESYKEFPGPIILLAGPGTGKTYQIAKRVKFLIEEMKAKPGEISVITFTNDAARNMRENLYKEDISIPKEMYPEIISTMHRLGNMIIGSNPSRFGLKEEYRVLNEKRIRELLLRDAAILAGFNKKEWKTTEECRRKGYCGEDINEVKCIICASYKSILRKCSLIDYDDQIFLACELLRFDEEIRSNWKNKTRYLLVDEYQDINQAQCDLIQLLSENQTEGLFVVGDDDQSIYSFRGGNPKYIREFDKSYTKNAKIGRLSKSWRCPEHILKGAQSIVNEYYQNRIQKPELTFSEDIIDNNKIVCYDVPSDIKEAQIIAKLAKEKISSNSIIIIIPNKNYLIQIKKALSYKGLWYKYKLTLNDDGLIRFTILSDWVSDPNDNEKMRNLLDLIVNNYDELTKKIVIKKKGISFKRKKATKIIANLWKNVNDKKSLFKIIKSLQPNNENNQYFIDLNACLNDIINLLSEKGNKRDGLLPFLEKCSLCVAPGKNPDNLVSEVREWKNELIGSMKGGEYEAVRIYNMPSSKGLEGEVIFVVGLSEGLFPDKEKNIEEQSRLFYVTMTRAKKELYLFNARTRSGKTTFDNSSYQLKRSPFINVIPSEHIEIIPIYLRKKKKKERMQNEINFKP